MRQPIATEIIMQNVGSVDRIIRVLLGVALIAFPFLLAVPVWAFWTSLVVGVVLLATAYFSFCPIYAALRISSRFQPKGKQGN